MAAVIHACIAPKSGKHTHIHTNLYMMQFHAKYIILQNVYRPNKNVCIEATGKIRSNKDIYEVIDGTAVEVGRFARRTYQRANVYSRTTFAKR